MRTFVPLTGEEIKELILRKIQHALDNDQHFRQHLTYPTIEWRWTLELNAAPHEPGTFDVVTQGSISNPGLPPVMDGKEAAQIPTTPLNLVIEGSEDVRAGAPGAPETAKAPDDVRDENGMDRVGPANVKIGGTSMIFDEAIKAKGGRAGRAPVKQHTP